MAGVGAAAHAEHFGLGAYLAELDRDICRSTLLQPLQLTNKPKKTAEQVLVGVFIKHRLWPPPIVNPIISFLKAKICLCLLCRRKCYERSSFWNI